MTATTGELVGWCKAVLSALGYPSTNAHAVGPLAWAYAEGGWSQNAAEYNCWNSTLKWPGSSTINGAGVQAYPSLTAGVDATIATLHGGIYAGILTQLANGTPDLLAVAVGQSRWGTPTATIQACIPRATSVLAIPSPVPPAPPTPEVPTMTDGAVIRWAYRFTLYREVDQAGYDANLAFLKGGGSRTQVLANLQDSTEGKAAIAAQRKALGL